ncbi:MAG: hypothetical protein J6W70_09280, partial [Lentisphaeria bacterium]|nr:hypothetical protein [Lentisphaeria bacterium]
MNKSRILALPFFGICIVFGWFFLETLLVPSYHFDQAGLLKSVLIIMVGAFLGTTFWILGTGYEKRAGTFRVLLIIATVVYGVCLFAALFGSVDVTRKNAGIQPYSFVPFRTIRAYFRAYSAGTVSTSVVIENL